MRKRYTQRKQCQAESARGTRGKSDWKVSEEDQQQKMRSGGDRCARSAGPDCSRHCEDCLRP